MANVNTGAVKDLKVLSFADRAEVSKPTITQLRRKLIKPCCVRSGTMVQSMPRPDVFINHCQECGAKHIRFHAETGKAFGK